MDLKQSLEYNHLFIKKAHAIKPNLVIYQTKRGPIFAVFGKNSVVKKYIGSKGHDLIKLHCSYDLRKEPSIKQKALLVAALDSVFGFKKPEFWVNKMVEVAACMEKDIVIPA